MVWLQLVASGETLMGLKLHPLFTIPAAIAAASLVPLLAADPLPRRIWNYVAGGCFGAALLAAIVAGLVPAYSQIMPQRLNLNYVVNNATGKAQWAAETDAPLPQSLQKAARFSSEPELPFAASWRKSYLAPAPQAQIQMPGAAVLANDVSGGLRHVTLGLKGSGEAAMMSLAIPGGVKLKRVTMGSRTLDVPAKWAKQKHILVGCMSADCRTMTMSLDMEDKGPVSIGLIERQAGLPGFATSLAAARPKTAVQSQFGDGIMLIGQVAVPAAK